MTEQEIILGCKRRKEKAYKALVDTYSNYLFSICKRYVIDDAQAKDCLQESLIQIIQKIDLYEERGKFKSWMGTVTVKKCLDFLRREKKFKNVDMTLAQEVGIEESAVFKLERDDVMKFLESIPEHYRIAINMFLIEGYSHKEIGEALGIGESSSRSLVSRGRKMIISAFQEENMKIAFYNRGGSESGKVDFKIIRS